ncbi:MAG: nucleotidyltransferase domain-containing protein [Chloroflexi bacterium]|nr:nucleotidyltransferase domain-containing protein [Chloroflexota bacterium]
MNLPDHLRPDERRAIEQAVWGLVTTHAEQVRYVALFGSKARGDFGPDSDLDLLVVIESDDWQTRDAVRTPVFDANIDHGVYLSPRVIGLERFRTLPERRPAFFRSLQRDALELWRRPGTENPLHPAHAEEAVPA